jgi:hypothetical protein
VGEIGQGVRAIGQGVGELGQGVREIGQGAGELGQGVRELGDEVCSDDDGLPPKDSCNFLRMFGHCGSVITKYWWYVGETDSGMSANNFVSCTTSAFLNDPS